MRWVNPGRRCRMWGSSSKRWVVSSGSFSAYSLPIPDHPLNGEEVFKQKESAGILYGSTYQMCLVLLLCFPLGLAVLPLGPSWQSSEMDVNM